MTYCEQLHLFDAPILAKNAKLGNQKLVEYGIQTEDSDYRIHVCGIYNVCYVFSTKKMLRYIENNNFKKSIAQINGVTTAEGWLVPIEKSIDRGIINPVSIPYTIWNKCPNTRQGETTIKGIWAMGIAKQAIEKGYITFNNINVEDIVSKVEQLQGIDLLVINNKVKVQVKCDQRACLKTHDPNGTGNLFIQFKECNTTRQY